MNLFKTEKIIAMTIVYMWSVKYIAQNDVCNVLFQRYRAMLCYNLDSLLSV